VTQEPTVLRPLPHTPHAQRCRYVLSSEIARGGMGSIHMGRMLGAHGFSRRVAIKRLLPQFACDEEFSAMLLEEARLSACVSHPNVAGVIDVVQEGDELWLVLEYIEGHSLARLMRRQPGAPVPPAYVVRILIDLLHGLAAVHEARDEWGTPLAIVHRDVSPQNVMVGVDGLSRLLDFGIAKARTGLGTTQRGSLKGKLSYLAPELLRLEPATPASDVYAAGLVMWEALVGRRPFEFATYREAFMRPQGLLPPSPSTFVPWIPRELDAIVLAALAPRPAERPESAHSLLIALEGVAKLASRSELGAWVRSRANIPDARLGEDPSSLERTRPRTPQVPHRTLVRGPRQLSMAIAVVLLLIAALGLAARVLSSRRAAPHQSVAGAPRAWS
jgi:serine/threonine protein kinase